MSDFTNLFEKFNADSNGLAEYVHNNGGMALCDLYKSVEDNPSESKCVATELFSRRMAIEVRCALMICRVLLMLNHDCSELHEAILDAAGRSVLNISKLACSLICRCPNISSLEIAVQNTRVRQRIMKSAARLLSGPRKNFAGNLEQKKNHLIGARKLLGTLYVMHHKEHPLIWLHLCNWDDVAQVLKTADVKALESTVRWTRMWQAHSEHLHEIYLNNGYLYPSESTQATASLVKWVGQPDSGAFHGLNGYHADIKTFMSCPPKQEGFPLIPTIREMLVLRPTGMDEWVSCMQDPEMPKKLAANGDYDQLWDVVPTLNGVNQLAKDIQVMKVCLQVCKDMHVAIRNYCAMPNFKPVRMYGQFDIKCLTAMHDLCLKHWGSRQLLDCYMDAIQRCFSTKREWSRGNSGTSFLCPPMNWHNFWAATKCDKPKSGITVALKFLDSIRGVVPDKKVLQMRRGLFRVLPCGVKESYWPANWPNHLASRNLVSSKCSVKRALKKSDMEDKPVEFGEHDTLHFSRQSSDPEHDKAQQSACEDMCCLGLVVVTLCIWVVCWWIKT